MKLWSASTQIAGSSEPDSKVETRLHGRWLILARVSWGAVVTLIGVLFVAALPAYVAQLYTVSGSGMYIPWQLSPESAYTLEHLGISLTLYATCTVVLSIATALVWVTVGGVLFWRKSNDWMALLVALMLVQWGTDIIAVLDSSNFLWQFSHQFLGFLLAATLFLFLSLFPDGRFVPRWVGWLVVIEIALVGGGRIFPDSPFNPNNWPAPLGSLFSIGGIGIIVGTQIYRYRYVSSLMQRQQTKWVVFALSIFLLGVAGEIIVVDVLGIRLPGLLSQFIGPLAFNLVPVIIPLSIGIAMLRYRLWDIDPIINRTLVYGVLTVSIVALYVLVVVGLGTLFQAQGNLAISLLATGLVAVLFQPLRTRLQRAVNRLIYGERDDPYAVLSRLGRCLEATLTPEAVLPTIVETVAQALKLPYAAITLKQGREFEIAASYGIAVETMQRLPLIYQTELIGELLLAPRAQGEAFSSADRHLLDDLARQAGVAAHAVRLTSDLQRSRERVVTTREEERRRLRRDLHDGLGPTLAALNLQAGVVRTLIRSDPVAADALVVEWRTELRAAIADIRRLVYELRPPALDELGLVGAIRERAAQYSGHAGTKALQTMVEVPDALPSLPAAVEVATYRIVQEALANVVHHAHARTCSIRLWIDDMLHVEITDDGIGLPAVHHAGVGLLSMRERAAELGGTCIIEPVVTGGTRVYAQLPLSKE